MRLLGYCLLLGLISCQTEEVRLQLPIIKTEPVTKITNTSVTFNATVMGTGQERIEHFGFTWNYKDEESEIARMDTLQEDWRLGQYSLTATNGLLRGKVINVRFYAKTQHGFIFADEQEFVAGGSAPPIISNVEPKNAFDGDTITIFGDNFFPHKKYVQVLVADEMATIVSSSTTKIQVIIPPLTEGGPVDIRVIVDGQSVTQSQALTITTPSIFSINILEGRVGDIIEITGENMSYPNAQTFVYFFDPNGNLTPSTLVFVSPSMIRLKIPDTFADPMPMGAEKIQMNVRVGLQLLRVGSSIRFSNPLQFNWVNSWKLISTDIPISSGLNVTVNDLVYWVGVDGNEVWSFNPENLEWVKRTSLPGDERYFMFATASENEIYVYTVYGSVYSIWSYDVTMDSWSFVTEIPPTLGTAIYLPTAGIIIGSKLYFRNYQWMYYYDLETNTFSENLPIALAISFYFGKVSNIPILITIHTTNVYVYRYNDISETWILSPDNTSIYAEGGLQFSSELNYAVLINKSISIPYFYRPDNSPAWSSKQQLTYKAALGPALVKDRIFVLGYSMCCNQLALLELELN